MSELIDNIKNLRGISGAGFLDCKKALEENNNNIEKSVDYLRKKGLAKVTKKSSRLANEGAVGFVFNDSKALLIEINSETDFAAKSNVFLDFLEKIAHFLLDINDNQTISIEQFMDFSFENKKISEHFNDLIFRIGENIVLRKIKVITKEPNHKIFTYTHNPYRKNIGKICSLIKIETTSQTADIEKFGKNLCMHIAASKPIALDIEDLDKNLIEKEKEIQREIVKSSDKSEEIIEKIIEGKMKKFYSEVTLLNQTYILDNEKNVKQAIQEFSSKNNFKLLDYSLFVLGNE